MTKNEIISKVIDKLLYQRGELNDKLCDLNHNEPNFIEVRQTLVNGINDIDMQLDRRIMDCEQFNNES